MATAPCTTTFEDLNTDTLLHIYSFVRDKNFKLLSRLARTSHRMKNKLYDPLFWKNAVAEFRYMSVKTALSLRTRNITKLKLKSSRKMTDLWSTLMNCAAVGSPEYIEIKLIEPLFSQDRDRHVSIDFFDLQNISSLRCLVITVYPTLSKKPCIVTMCQLIKGVVRALKDLTELIVYYNQPNEFRSSIAESLGHLPKLKTLEIKHYGIMPELPSPQVSGMCSIADQACYPTIEKVAGLLPLTVAHLVHTFPNLKHLDLTVQREEDSHVLDLLHGKEAFLPNISSLELEVETLTSLRNIKSISLALPLFQNLNALRISIVINNAQQRDLLLEGVMNCSQQLKVLKLYLWCKDSVTYMQATSIVYNFKQLEILELRGNQDVDCERRQDCLFHQGRLFDILPNLICNGVRCSHFWDRLTLDAIKEKRRDSEGTAHFFPQTYMEFLGLVYKARSDAVNFVYKHRNKLNAKKTSHAYRLT